MQIVSLMEKLEAENQLLKQELAKVKEIHKQELIVLRRVGRRERNQQKKSNMIWKGKFTNFNCKQLVKMFKGHAMTTERDKKQFRLTLTSWELV